MTERGETVTVLFTDVVGSTEVQERAGDERAQRIFKAHHALLRDAVEAHGGHEVKWLGDGLMVAFPSAADAVRCAVAMQQAARRPAAGERLRIRVGLNLGEAIRDEADYYGMPVIIARRLCDRASAGQIIASSLVVGLLSARREFRFEDLGKLTLKGLTEPFAAYEVLYEHDPVAMLTTTPFVGRNGEMAALGARLDAAVAGKGGLTVLVGEPGIGKTRTIEEFSTETRGRGARVLAGRCYDGEWAPPFSPFVEALRDYARDALEPELRTALGVDAGVLARIVPAVRERLPDIEEPPALQAEGERYRLLEAVSNVLGRIAETRPLALVLDDLHWADNGTIAMLRYAARAAASRRILLLGAYRDVELDRQHPLSAALADLRRETNFERIVLRGLAVADIGALLDVVTESAVGGSPRALVEAIAAETNGNPFFIREVLLHLVEERKIVQEDGRWTSTLSIAEIGIPEGVKEVIGRRLSRLSDGCNEMLTSASALTGGFTWAELEAIAGDVGARRGVPGAGGVAAGANASLLDALDESLAAQILVETAPATYDFTHALIRHTLYDELSTPRRVLLHRHVGEALERLYADDVDAHTPELAYHYSEAADIEKGVAYCRAAAEHAGRVLAYNEAVRHLKRALAMVTDERRRCELLLSLADMQSRSGEQGGSLQAFEEGGTIALRLGANDLLVQAALGAQIFGHTGAANAGLLEAALDVLPPGDSATRARCMAKLAPLLAREPRGRELSQQAIDMARRIADSGTLCRALAAEYIRLTIARPHAVRERLAIADEIVDLATANGHLELALADGHCNRLQDYVRLGEIANAEADIAAHERLANELRQGSQQWHSLSLSAMRALLQGRFREGEAYAEQASDLGERISHPFATSVRALQLFLIRRDQGRSAELIRASEAAKDDTSSVGEWVRAGLAAAYADEARLEDAQQLLQRFSVPSLKMFPDFLARASVVSEAIAYVGSAAAGLAAQLYAELLPVRTHAIVVGDGANMCLGSAGRYLGLLATTLEQYEDAERHFEDALEMNARMGARPWVARTQLDYARMLLHRDAKGDRARARALLEAALATASEIGMAKVAADCEGLLAET